MTDSAISVRKAIKGVVLSVPLLYLAFILTLTHMPLDSVSEQPWFKYSTSFWIDKVIQCTLYSGLVAIFGCAVFPLSGDLTKTIESISGVRVALLASLIVVIAFVDEFTQPFFGRNCEVLDIVADVAGLIPGFCLFLIINEARHMLLSAEA